MTPADFVKKHWLLVGILVCIFFAAIYPELGSKNGPLHTEITVKYGATTLIFLISGLSLKLNSIFQAFRQLELHFFVQVFTFILIPVLTQFLVKCLQIFDLNSWILKGLITVACMPPPVSSAIILTRAAGGNESVAIFNSILGSYLGIIITPLLLLFNLGSTSVLPISTTFMRMTVTIVAPLALGIILRNFTNFRGYHLPLNSVGQCALLFVIYTTFCDTFETPEVGLSALDIIFTVFSVLFMQIGFIALSYALASYSRYFDEQDIIAIMFCSTHKSLTLGIPVLRIMFHGYSHLSQISLPLLVYHPTQIILGGMMVSQLKSWVQKRYKLPK